MLQQKIHHVQEQMKLMQTAATKRNADHNILVQGLQLQLKEMEAQNVALKSEKEMEAIEHTKVYHQLQQQYDQCNSDRIEMVKELDMVKTELESTKQELQRSKKQEQTSSVSLPNNTSPTIAGVVPTTTVLTSVNQVKRTNLIHRLEMSIAQDTTLIQSLQSLISVVSKKGTRPSKKVQEGLTEKKIALNEKRMALINKLEKIDKLLEQQVKSFQPQLEDVTTKKETARKEWHTCEEQLVVLVAAGSDDTVDHPTTTTTTTTKKIELLQAKADAAANMYLTQTRQYWQPIHIEHVALSTKQSQIRNQLIALRKNLENDDNDDNDDNDGMPTSVEENNVARTATMKLAAAAAAAAATTTTTATTTSKTRSTPTTSSMVKAKSPPAEKRANPPTTTTTGRQVKRPRKA
jgi:hypothetical protein